MRQQRSVRWTYRKQGIHLLGAIFGARHLQDLQLCQRPSVVLYLMKEASFSDLFLVLRKFAKLVKMRSSW